MGLELYQGSRNEKRIVLSVFFLSLFARVLSVIYQELGGSLPDNGKDTANFHLVAIDVLSSFAQTVEAYPVSSSYVWSYILAGVYFLFGSSELTGKIFVTILSSATIPILYLLLRDFSTRKVAIIFSLSYSLFPPFVIWGSILLRESIIVLFLVLGFFYQYHFMKKSKGMDAFLMVIFYSFASVFHPGVAVFAFINSTLTIFLNLNKKVLKNILIFVLTLSVVFVVSNRKQIGLSKLGFLYSDTPIINAVLKIEKLLDYNKDRSLTIHENLELGSLTDLFISIPVLVFGFIMSPLFSSYGLRVYTVVQLPLSIFVSFNLIFGFFALFMLNTKTKWYLSLYISLIFSLMTFSFASSDAWAAFRHLGKFVPFLILIGAANLRFYGFGKKI